MCDKPSQRQPRAMLDGMDQLRRDDEAHLHGNKDKTAEAKKRMREEEISFYSNSENEYGDDNIWGLLSGVAGNIYEWYDFAVYGLLAPEIGQSFFPTSSDELQLINSFGVYLAAFLMRPLGAIVFGEMGDRLVGRRNALVFSILLITIPSILMGLLPTYDTWGVAAPVLLVLLRMMQGLSVGGQLAGSYVISIEQSSPRTRGFRGSVCDASSVGGFLLASAVTTLTRSVLSDDQVNDWGWRCPFLFSLLLAPVLYKIVKNTEESRLWTERSEQQENEGVIRETERKETPAVVDLFSSPFRRRQLVGMVGVLSAVSSSFYTLFLWTPVYLSHLRGILTEKDADLMNFVVVGFYICFLLLSGKLSDTFPHRMDLIRIGLPGIIVACPTMFGMFESESRFGYLFAQLSFGLCLSLVQGSMAAWEVELWMADPTLSFTGVAIGHNLASTVFGGTMPLIATFLFYRADKLDASSSGMLWPRVLPGLYVSILGFLALYCISKVVRHPHDVRTGDAKLKQQVASKKASRDQKAKLLKLEGELLSGGGLSTESYIPPVL
jgi:MHS family proline/betaine transporter-like MFS transporter